MDYEKKYKDALEKMKSWVRGEHPECFSEAQKAAEFIFPELRESEDERIRKGIVETIKQCPDTFLNPKNRNKMLAYLEKQKEQKPAERFAEAREEYEVEWSRKEVVDIDHWSGGDDAMLESILSDINYATPPYKKGNDEYIRKIAWVKSLRPQPKQEWSEEDEKTINDACTFIDKYADSINKLYLTKSLELYRLSEKLKSLRPSWKPSEEQMEALNALNCHGDLSYVGQQNQLISLYNDLKKLI